MMAGRLSISFLVSNEVRPSVSPPPDVNLPSNANHDEQSPRTYFPNLDHLPRPSVFSGSPPLLLASSQLPSNSQAIFDPHRLSSHRYDMSDLDLPRSPHSSQSSRSYESSQRPEYDQHPSHVSTSTTHISRSPSTHTHASFSPQSAYARPPSGSPATSYTSLPKYDSHRSPVLSHHTLPPLQHPARFHPAQSQYFYSQNRPSSSTGNYSNQTHSPLALRSRSHSDADLINHPQHRSVSDFAVSYHQQCSPSPPPRRDSHSSVMGRGLEALVQAASQESRRLSNDHANLQEPRHHGTYSPNHGDYSPSAPAHGTTYSAEFGGNVAIEPLRKRRRSSGSQDDVMQAHVLEVTAPERLTQDRSSFMRISHIASDYHPTDQVSTSAAVNIVTATEKHEDTEDRLASYASSASSPIESESDVQISKRIDVEEPRTEEILVQERPPSAASEEEEEDDDEKFVGYNTDNRYAYQETLSQCVSPPSHLPVLINEGAHPVSVQEAKSSESEIPPSRPASVPSITSEQNQSPPASPITAELELEVAPRPVAEHDDMTVDMDFDLAASKSENGVDFEMDVEDELLRLVDDETSHGHRQARESWRRSPNTSITDILLDVEAPLHFPSEPAPAVTESTVAQQPSSETTETKKTTKGTSSRKKQPAGKAHTKPKQPAKSRGKTAAKAKATAPQHVDMLSVSYTASGRLTKHSAPPFPVSLTNTKLSDSRSTSVMPFTSEVEQTSKQADHDYDKENVDDKVYCICRSHYEEGKVMIACDRCDEWYHMQCLAMSDLAVDLVDQFICPVCVENNPNLSLSTTYKQRCFAGLGHANPFSPNACHKPSRGAFSKYCSEECGISYMQTKIDAWAANGGDKAKLWDNVKDADKREGVVIAVHGPEVKTEIKTEAMELDPVPIATFVRDTPDKEPRMANQKERELVRLQSQLDKVVQLRDVMKNEMEIILWRATLTQLASDRAEGLDECGWDQRLRMDDEEYAEMGASVLESYEAQGTDDQGATPEVDGEWWCRGKKKCDRHSGWQKLRSAEVGFEKEMKETGLSQLATREREIRKRIEDITDPQRPMSMESGCNVPQPNGSGGKAKVNGSIAKSGKKRKAVF